MDLPAKISQLISLRKQGLEPGRPRGPAQMISEETVAQKLSHARNVVVLTGAGISAESGVPTWRGDDGFWTGNSKNQQPQQLFRWEKFNEQPEDLWRSFKSMASVFEDAKPNPGHYALVELEQLIHNFSLVTQNIDGLHDMAGTSRHRLFEIHGRIDEIRCDDRISGSCLHGMDLQDPANFAKVRQTIRKPQALTDEGLGDCCCAACGKRQRPNIMFFDDSYNEPLNGRQSVNRAVHRLTGPGDVLLIIGTQHKSGLPRWMVKSAGAAGATVIKIDASIGGEPDNMLCLQAKSGEALPKIVSSLRNLIQAKGRCTVKEPAPDAFLTPTKESAPRELEAFPCGPTLPRAPLDWSEWEEVRGCCGTVLECVEEQPLGFNIDGGRDGTVYVESVRPGSWAARMNMAAPCKVIAVNDLDVQQMPKDQFEMMMQCRPVKLTLKRLQCKDVCVRNRSRSRSKAYTPECKQVKNTQRRERSRSRKPRTLRGSSTTTRMATTPPRTPPRTPPKVETREGKHIRRRSGGKHYLQVPPFGKVSASPRENAKPVLNMVDSFLSLGQQLTNVIANGTATVDVATMTAAEKLQLRHRNAARFLDAADTALTEQKRLLTEMEKLSAQLRAGGA